MFRIDRPVLNRRQILAGNLILLLIFLAAAVLSLWTIFPHTLVAVFWPPAGLALAAMYRYGLRLGVGAWGGAFGAGMLGLLQAEPAIHRGTAAGAAAMIACGALLALLVGCQLMERLGRRWQQERHAGQVAVLLGTGMISSLVSAVVGALAIRWAVPGANVFYVWLGWWLSCTLGVFLFAPLAFAWWGKTEVWRGKRRGEAILCLSLLAVVTAWSSLVATFPRFGGVAVGFVVLPFLTWAAVRLGYRATTTALVILAAIAVESLRRGAVMPGGMDESEALPLMAARLLFIIPTTLCIAAVVRERVEAENSLQQINQNLEGLVQRRTKSLRQLAEQLRNEVEHQKRTAVELRESQERLELAVRAAQVGHWDADLQTGTVHYSPEWKAQLGYAPDELWDQAGVWRQLLHPEDRAAAIAKVDDYLAGRTNSYAAEFRLRHKDGSYRWILSRGNLFRDAEGKLARLMGCHLDITERKRTSLRLEAFALLGKRLSSAYTVGEAAQVIVDVAENLLGWDAAVLVLSDDRSGRCRSVLDIDLIEGRKQHFRSRCGDGPLSPIMARVVARGPELVLREAPVKASADFHPFGDEQRPSASLMFVPVRDGERTVAMLSIQSYQLNAYTRADLETLQALADHCGGALARIRSREIQKASELSLVAAQLQAKMGSWELHFQPRQIQWSAGMFALVGRDADKGAMPFEEFVAHVYPGDRVTMEKLFAHLGDLYEKRTAEFRYVTPAGVVRNFAMTIECERDEEGRAVKASGVLQDITQQKESEQALRESGERLRLALDVAQMGTWDLDLGSLQVLADLRLSRMFGGPTADLLQKPEEFVRYIHPEDLPRLREAIEGATAQTNQFHELFRVVWPDQAVRWLEAYGSVFRGSEGQALRVVGATVDVTERHQAEQALRRSEKQYAELVNNIDGIVWEADVATLRMTFVSHQAANILGYPASDWVTNPTFWRDHIHPDDRETAISYCAARTSLGEDHNFEYRMIAVDGRAVWLADFVTVIMEEGRPVTLRGIMVDITRRKQLEHEQARSYSLLQATLESSQDGLLVVDRDGVVRDFNQRFLELWRLPSDMVTRRRDHDWQEFVREQLEQPDDFLATGQQLGAAPEQESFEIINFRDGRVYERYSRPQRLKGEIIGRVWSFRDVTERRRNERLLLGQTKILEDIARGVPLAGTLMEICRTVEQSSPGLWCSVLLVDEDGRHLRAGAAPRIPDDLWQALQQLEVGPNAASCGAAVYRGATVIAEDIATDPLWEGLRSLALAAGMRSCWSTPIFDPHGGVVGTLAFYYPTPRRPTARERRSIEMATHAAAIAIMKHRADQQLARSARVLRQLSANQMKMHEAERRHLARELHDELGQILTATKILLESHRHDLARVAGDGADMESTAALRTAIGHVETMLQQVRTLSLSLRPTILDDCGLAAALRWLLDQHTRTTGRPARFDLKSYEAEVSPTVETACFRIAQEALTNISRHSKAREVNVELQCDSEHLTLVVRDDGVGFDVAAATAQAHAGGSVGLLGQQERAALIGGEVKITSRPGNGTEIRARFPVGTRLEAIIKN